MTAPPQGMLWLHIAGYASSAEMGHRYSRFQPEYNVSMLGQLAKHLALRVDAVRQHWGSGVTSVITRLFPQTHIQSAPAATEKQTHSLSLSNNVLTEWSRNPIHLVFKQCSSSRRACDNLTENGNEKVFLVWLQSSSRRTAMAGSGWSFSPPLCYHTSAAVTAAVTVTGSPGRNHSDLSAGEGYGCRKRLPKEAVHSTAAAASSAIPAWEQAVIGEDENTPRKRYQLFENTGERTIYM